MSYKAPNLDSIPDQVQYIPESGLSNILDNSENGRIRETFRVPSVIFHADVFSLSGEIKLFDPRESTPEELPLDEFVRSLADVVETGQVYITRQNIPGILQPGNRRLRRYGWASADAKATRVHDKLKQDNAQIEPGTYDPEAIFPGIVVYNGEKFESVPDIDGTATTLYRLKPGETWKDALINVIITDRRK